MKNYKQLTSEQRYQIYGLKQAGLNQAKITKNIGVDKSTISREFKHLSTRPNQNWVQKFRLTYLRSDSFPD